MGLWHNVIHSHPISYLGKCEGLFRVISLTLIQVCTRIRSSVTECNFCICCLVIVTNLMVLMLTCENCLVLRCFKKTVNNEQKLKTGIFGCFPEILIKTELAQVMRFSIIETSMCITSILKFLT